MRRPRPTRGYRAKREREKMHQNARNNLDVRNFIGEKV